MASDGSRRNPVKTYVVCITSTGYALYHAVGLDPYQTNKDSFLHAVRGDLSSFISVMRLCDSHDFQSEAEFCEEKRALSDPHEIFDEAYDLGHFLHCGDYESVELGVFAPHITEFLKEFADVQACVFNEFYLEVSKCAGRNYDKYIDKYDPESRDRPVKYGLPLLGYGEYSGGGGIVWYKAGEKWDARSSHGRTSKSEKKEKQGLMVLAEDSHEGKEKKIKKAEKKRKRKEEEEKTHDEEVQNVKSEKKEKRKLAKCSHERTSESEKKEKKLQYRKEITKRERSQQKLVTQGLMVLAEESQEFDKGKEKKMMKKAEKKRKRKEEEENTHDKEVHNVKSEKKEKKRKLAKCSHGRTSKSEKKKKKLRKLEHS